MGQYVFQSKLRSLDPLDLLASGWFGRVFLVVFLLGSFFFAWIFETEARSSKRHATASRSSPVTRTARSGRSSRTSRSGRARAGRRSGGRTRGARSSHAPVHHGPIHHGPSEAQIKRQETSGANDLEKRSALERSYQAYDQGLSEWMSGNYGQAAKNLNASYELYSDFHGSHDVLDSLYLFDLGQAAEAAGDVSLAKNSYQRSLRRRPDFSDCCIRLSALLTKNGETALALVYARRLADKNPQDPRAQLLLATMLERAGFAEEGKTARENFNLLMKGGAVNKPQIKPDSGDNVEQPPKESVQKEDTDTESGVLKKDESEKGSSAGALKKPDSQGDDNGH